MKTTITLLSALWLSAAAHAGNAAAAVQAAVLPAPVEWVASGGDYAVAPRITVGAVGRAAAPLAKELTAALAMRGYTAKAVGGGKAVVAVALDDALGEEAYRIKVATDGIEVAAGSPKGAFYAAQTLVQMLDQSPDRRLACCTIADAPRFGYRGLMLDVVRGFIPFDEVKRIVDMASRLKLNTLHLHLTDDNGWRLQIKKYPRLTEVGAWRVDRGDDLFPACRNPRPDEPATYGGFYTQAQMRDLVGYAAARHVDIIPEIEMPAHSIGAIASYPWLACPVGGDDEFVGVLPGIGGKMASVICCAGSERVFQFYCDVLDEVMDLFPSPYVNIGGDEAEKSRWRRCPLCQRRMADEGIGDVEQLQGYFMDRINRHLQSRGRTAIGWDEIALGGPKEPTVVLGWHGDGSAAVRFARQTGNRFILSPARTLYLIRYQGPQWFEPFTYFGNNTLRDVYGYEPVGADWDEGLRSRLLGIQASMWTEFCRTPAQVEYMLFPRLIALADAAWRPQGSADWPRFLAALDRFLPTLDAAGMAYARSMYNLDHKVEPAGKGVRVALSCIRPDVAIRYSRSADMAGAQPYAAPLAVDTALTLYAATFKGGVQMGRTLRLDLQFNKATGRTVAATAPCRNGLAAVLTNGVRGSDRNSDFEWAGWHNETADFTVDLGEETRISRVALGTLVNSDVCVAAPRRLYVYASTDGAAFTLLKEVEVADATRYAHPATRLDIDCGVVAATARYVRFVAVNPGCVPDGYPREASPTWMYFDEIIIN